MLELYLLQRFGLACAGHAIGVIVADTEAAAQAGSRAVAVTYQDILPILSIEQAIEANSYFEVLHASLYISSSEPLP